MKLFVLVHLLRRSYLRDLPLSISNCTNQNKIWIKRLNFAKRLVSNSWNFFWAVYNEIECLHSWIMWDLSKDIGNSINFSLLSLFSIIFSEFVACCVIFYSHSLIMTVLPLWYYPSEAHSLLICFFFLFSSFFFFINISSVITAVQYRHRSPVTPHKLMFPTKQPFAEA